MNLPSPTAPVRGVLLVHGAWHTGHAWDGVAAGLRTLGVPVAVAELHRGSLAADIAAAEDALDRLSGNGPAVACGHSYGGAVITGLAPERVDHLVYLAAMMPDHGETALGLLAGAPPTALATAMVGDRAGVTTIAPGAAGELFHGQLGTAERARHTAGLVPQAMAAGLHPTASPAWRERPSTYVVCSEDRAVHPELQGRFAARATHVLTWRSDHGAFASHRDETVGLLHRLATTGSPARQEE
ncbi:alpha/beta hydrolase [Kitasatospora sp. NPDC096147]|uniref:alpha/beta hydrolase n=1 Tax=Kitasatospora sp. NPDC096147 TaxID=3364093 RepID=UPI0037FF6EF2